MAEYSRSAQIRNLAKTFLIFSPLLIGLIYVFGPRIMYNDWAVAFYPVSQIPLTPYENQYFINPPWVAAILWPLSFLSLDLARAFNVFLALFFVSLLVLRYGGDMKALLWVITSAPFFSLVGNGSVDWIVVAGVLFASAWTVPLVLAKPQTGFFLVFLWFLRSREKLEFILISLAFFALSLLIWGLWPVDMVQNIMARPLAAVNLSLFPWTIPLGLFLLYYAWKHDDDLAAVWGGLFMAPYFVAHSLILGFVIFVGRFPKWTPILWLILWIIHP
jgi:hypothetical protein